MTRFAITLRCRASTDRASSPVRPCIRVPDGLGPVSARHCLKLDSPPVPVPICALDDCTDLAYSQPGIINPVAIIRSPGLVVAFFEARGNAKRLKPTRHYPVVGTSGNTHVAMFAADSSHSSPRNIECFFCFCFLLLVLGGNAAIF